MCKVLMYVPTNLHLLRTRPQARTHARTHSRTMLSRKHATWGPISCHRPPIQEPIDTHTTPPLPSPDPHSKLRAILCSRLLLLIPQHAPQNLPAGTLGNHLDKLDAALEPLIPRLVVGDILVQRLGHVLVGAALCGGGGFHDEGFGDFARVLFGYLDHRAVRDELVAEEVGFELGWRDLVAL